ncbi:hypothetical protein ACSVDA_01375 [Cytobacillus sp. Hm23]
MKKFECEVTRIDQSTVELDETVLDEEWMEHFREHFYNFHTLEEHVEHIAQFRARFGSKFIEGYSVPLENGKLHIGLVIRRYIKQ